MKPRGKVIFIVGPTAVGKTSVAIRLAKTIEGEIVSCDSMQVYKGMLILSQAPTAADKKNVRHHLVGYRDPRREYSVAAFRKEASKVVADICRKGKVPVIVGGSGLYMKALVDGLFPSPRKDTAFREKMERCALRHGREELYKKLFVIDPQAAAKIHPNDMRRTIRALEIFHTSGKTMTELKANTKGFADRYDVRIYGIIRPREEICDRINRRVEKMFKSGIVNEVKRLMKKKLSMTAGTILGLREIRSYLDGECDLEEAKEAVKLNTRKFAKRQLTWFRADKRIVWLDASRMTERDMVGKMCK